MDNALASHAWLAGDSYSIADAAFTPYVVRLDHLDVMGLLDPHPAHRRLVSPDQGPAELPGRHRALGERRLPRADETPGPGKLAQNQRDHGGALSVTHTIHSNPQDLA